MTSIKTVITLDVQSQTNGDTEGCSCNIHLEKWHIYILGEILWTYVINCVFWFACWCLFVCLFLLHIAECPTWLAMEWCWLQTGWQGLQGGQGHRDSKAAAAAFSHWLAVTAHLQLTSFPSFSLFGYTFPPPSPPLLLPLSSPSSSFPQHLFLFFPL